MTAGPTVRRSQRASAGVNAGARLESRRVNIMINEVDDCVGNEHADDDSLLGSPTRPYIETVPYTLCDLCAVA